MRVPAFLVAALVALTAAAPTASADTASLETRDAGGTAKRAFEDGETVVFRVTVRVTQNAPVAHRVYVYAGTGTSGDLVGVVDTGQVTSANRHFDLAFDIAWDQTIDGVRVPAGQYTAQFRSPDGTLALARFDLDWGPDMVMPFLRVETSSEVGFVGPVMTASGCVRNDGVQPVPAARLTVAFLGATGWTTSPLTQEQPLGPAGPCLSHVYRGTVFVFQFIAPPGTTSVRVAADAPGTVEQVPGNEARTVAARWTL